MFATLASRDVVRTSHVKVLLIVMRTCQNYGFSGLSEFFCSVELEDYDPLFPKPKLHMFGMCLYLGIISAGRFDSMRFGMLQDCCLIPESPFYLEGRDGLYEFIEQRLKENGHVVIVLAEGAGQEYVAQSMHRIDEKDASGNRLLLDVGLWLSQRIKVPFFSAFLLSIHLF